MVENRKEPNFRGSKKRNQIRKSNWINFIGLIVLALALIAAAIIIVFYFSVEVKVENPVNNTESSTTSTTVVEQQTSTNSGGPGEVAPSEEVVPEPVPSEEPAESMPSEEDKEASGPSEEGETEMPEEVIYYSNLKVKVQIDHIGKVWTRWTMINQAEGTTIGHDEIVNLVLADMAKEFGNVAYQKSEGEKAEYTFSQADATYGTVIWILG